MENEKKAKMKVIFDVGSARYDDEEGVNKYLVEGFEPFGVTPEPMSPSLTNPGQIKLAHRMWFKRPMLVPADTKIEMEQVEA